MMKRLARLIRRMLLIGALLGKSFPLIAQEGAQAGSTVLDRLLDERESEIDAESMERLTQLIAEPLNLREADDEALRALPLLPTELIDRLIAWRSAGTIKSYAELRAIPGMKSEHLRLLKMMTLLGEARPDRRGSVRLRTRSSVDEEDLHSMDGRYALAQQSDMRLTVSHGSASESVSFLGDIRVEKDAGEKRWNDLVTGHMTIADRTTGLRAVVGTFRFGHADGILVRRTSSLSGGNDGPGQLVRRATGARGSASSDVQSVFRGLAVGWNTSGTTFEGFISEKGVHATVDDHGVLTSLYASDLFRTESQKLKRNSARERGYGGRIEHIVQPGLSLSAAALYTILNKPTAGSVGTAAAGGISFGILFEGEHSTWTAEAARDLGRSISWRSAGSLMLDSRISLGLEAHAYAPLFMSRRGGGASLKKDNSRNETGGSLAVHFTPTDQVEIDFSGGRATFSEEKRAILTDLHTSFLRLLTTTRLTSNAIMEISLKDQRQGELRTQSEGRGTPSLGESRRRSLQWTVRSTPTTYLRLMTRFDLVRSWSSGNDKPGNATRVIQDVRLRGGESFSIVGRVAYYLVDRYDARLYDVAPDLPGAGGFQLHLGTGIQWTIVATVRLTAGLACSAKYVQTDVLPYGDGARLAPQRAVRSEGGLQIEATIPIP